jgi:hypothetical protein
MKAPGFTAEAGLGPTVEQYAVGVVRTRDDTGELRPALVAPTVCRTSGCFTVGNCRTRVRCCRNFLGICSCRTLPCFVLGQA